MAKTLVKTAEDIRQLGTIMGIWAHPDDESFCCAGLMAAAIENGQQVVCVTATKGEAGVQDAQRWPPERLADIRAAELQEAMKVVGIVNHHWLNYPDGGCQQVDQDSAIAQLVPLIRKYQPNTILTFGPDGMTGHPDHQTVSMWAHQAAQQSGLDVVIYHAVQSKRIYDLYLKVADEQFDIFFNIDEPPLRDETQCDVCFCLPPDLTETKLRALAAMPSQTEAMLKSAPEEQLRNSFGVECFERAERA